MSTTAPIACTLGSGELEHHLASIGTLARDALRSHTRRDLVVDLRYAPEARERVREMVRNERTCCSFLDFDLHESPEEIRLVITAPEAARQTVDVLFEQFVAGAPAAAATQPGATAAAVTAATLATGAVACGACCVLPFALPAAMLAGTGGVLAWFVSMRPWMTGLAVLAVVGAWAWIGWQTRQTRRRPAASTVLVMIAATALLAAAVLWPLIERPLIRALTA